MIPSLSTEWIQDVHLPIPITSLIDLIRSNLSNTFSTSHLTPPLASLLLLLLLLTMMRQTTTPLPQLIYPRVIHLRRRLKDLIYNPVSGARIDIQVGPVHESFITWEEAITERYEPIRVGDSFSPASVTKDGVKEFPWTQRWFRVDLKLPHPHNKGEHELCLYFLSHGEFTVYTSNGDVWCGIDPIHDRIPISSLLQGDQNSITLWIDGGKCTSCVSFQPNILSF